MSDKDETSVRLVRSVALTMGSLELLTDEWLSENVVRLWMQRCVELLVDDPSEVGDAECSDRFLPMDVGKEVGDETTGERLACASNERGRIGMIYERRVVSGAVGLLTTRPGERIMSLFRGMYKGGFFVVYFVNAGMLVFYRVLTGLLVGLYWGVRVPRRTLTT